MVHSLIYSVCMELRLSNSIPGRIDVFFFLEGSFYYLCSPIKVSALKFVGLMLCMNNVINGKCVVVTLVSNFNGHPLQLHVLVFCLSRLFSSRSRQHPASLAPDDPNKVLNDLQP